MHIKSLFLVILRVLGLFFLRDFLSSLPSFLSLISVLLGYSGGSTLSTIVGGLLVISVFGFVAYMLLFQTHMVIEKFRLTEGFEEEKFSFNIHRSTVLFIAVTIIGALMITTILPTFLRQLFLLFQETKSSAYDPYPKADKTLLIVEVIQIIIGLLVLGNVWKIVSYVELKRRKTSIEESDFNESESDENQAMDNKGNEETT